MNTDQRHEMRDRPRCLMRCQLRGSVDHRGLDGVLRHGLPKPAVEDDETERKQVPDMP